MLAGGISAQSQHLYSKADIVYWSLGQLKYKKHR